MNFRSTTATPSNLSANPSKMELLQFHAPSTRYTYPASFMLIATMNPCPCGYLGDRFHECTCTEAQIQTYKNVSPGPILDRIDMVIHVNRVPTADLLPISASNTSTSLDTPTKIMKHPTIVKNNKTDSIDYAPLPQDAQPQKTPLNQYFPQQTPVAQSTPL